MQPKWQPWMPNLTKFGYKQDMKIYKLKHLFICLATNSNDAEKFGDFS